MPGPTLYALACLSLGGCVTNHITMPDAQVMQAGAASPVRAQPAAPAPVMTPTARLANASMITMSKATNIDVR